MPYNPEIHHRRSIRFKGYDYSQPGMYFVTICLQNKTCLFGKVVDGEMQLNDAGRMVEKWYQELQNKFPDIQCQEMVVMPNHFHCIIHNVGMVGADLRVCPSNKLDSSNLLDNQNHDSDNQNHDSDDQNHDSDDRNRDLNDSNHDSDNRNDISTKSNISGKPEILGEHIGSPLQSVVQWFKTMTTNEYIRGVKNHHWPRFDGKLWQRNYWEHIIRNEKSYRNIAEYILNNPAKWHQDSLNLNASKSKEK